MEFKEWLLFLESQTVSQYLQQQQHLPVKEIKRAVIQGLQSLPFFTEGRGRNQKVLEMFAKFFAFQWINARMENLTHRERMTVQQQRPQQQATPAEKEYWAALMKPAAAAQYVQQKWTEWGAFFSARIDDNALISKLNNANYTPEMVDQDTQQWHLDISARERGKGSDDGKVVLQLDNIGWKKWTWVHMEDRGSCSVEAQAMGHCGNVGQEQPGDTILSLRDPENYAHLTFILNDGVLGEMKGRQNTKPVAKYHPAIAELLKLPIIDSIRGGGYAPESNFEFDDLDEETQNKIKEQKPHIDNWVDFLVEGGRLDKLKDILEAPNLTYDKANDLFTVETYDDLIDLDDFVEQDIEPYFGEDSHEAFETYHVPEWNSIQYHITKEMKQAIMKYGEDHWDELDDDKKEEYEEDGWDEEDIFDSFDELKSAIQIAYSDAERAGAETQAYNQFIKEMSSPPNSDYPWPFWFDMNHPYKLQTNKAGIKEMLKDQGQIEYYGGIEDYLKHETPWKFEPPYNGWDDFDEDTFEEMFKERMAEIE